MLLFEKEQKYIRKIRKYTDLSLKLEQKLKTKYGQIS
jgi:hypothetical protein